MITITEQHEQRLDDVTRAAREQFSDAELDAATARFKKSLPAAAAAAPFRGLPRWLKLSGAMAALVLTVTSLSLLLPGNRSGSAFAQAQAWFERYDTLQLVLTARRGQQELYRMTVWHERGGSARIDIPPISQLVDLVRGELIIVMPGGQVMRQDLPGTNRELGGREELAWLDELRAFRGQAELLPEQQMLDGIAADGWRLELSGMQQTLWVDPADQRPLRLDGQLGGGVSMESVFTFDQALPEDVFSLPGVGGAE